MFNPAKEFYDLLLQAADTAGDGDVRHCYHLLNIALHRSVEQKLIGSKIHFGGLFAKTDYLAKEHDVDKSVMLVLGQLRQRLREIAVTPTDVLQDEWAQSVEALALYIYKVYGGEDIPEALRSVFPKRHKRIRRKRLLGDVMRMLVEQWDDKFIHGTTDELGATTVAISENWQYITQLLAAGTLINIVKPREVDNAVDGSGEKVIEPELIIYQPDYLVDVSSVASCFETYAETPYVALLNKLKTVPPTRAIHLGNLASQFLDEEVHGSQKTYAESVTEFFHNHAIDMAAATDIDSTFHEDAKRQRANIHSAVRGALEKEVGHFDAAKSLLEPSFFCETLGLQGRMDLLQSDFRVLIEQKSGKGALRSTATTPQYHEKHYVQMLLYMAALHYGYKLDSKPIANAHIQSFLLYSKYTDGLVRLGPAPELLHHAIMMRNQLAWCEMSYARGDGKVLLRMKPEQLRRKEMSDRFWNMWIRPQLDEVLVPIQTATPLEQKYFLRMLRFVAQEHLMSKMGSNTKENSGFASKWHDTLDDKLMAGNIFCGLYISELMHEDKEQSTSVVAVRLTAPTTDSALSANFRLGDIVTLYPYEALREPDIRTTMVHRGSIEEIHIDEDELNVTVHLRSPQTTPAVFDVRHGFCWAIEHDFYESSATAQYRSLHQFLTAPVHRRQLILGTRQLERNESQTLKGDYGKFNSLVLGALQANDLYLVIGPPGTGKTSFGLLNILKEHLLHDATVLLMAFTNRAVDEICSKLVEEGLPFIRMGGPLSCEKKYRPYLLQEQTKSCRNIDQIRQLVSEARIVVGTTTSLTSASTSLFSLKSFDLAIIDEASQILEPQLLGLLSATNGIDVAIRKFVLIGDHKQLPAVVQQSAADSAVDDPDLQTVHLTDCRNSWFERQIRIIHDSECIIHNSSAETSQPPVGHSASISFLHAQGRMHPDIASFPNAAFYDGKLGIAGLPHQMEESDADHPRVRFIPVEAPERSQSDKVNDREAVIIAKEVFNAYQEAGDKFDVLQTVGVIVPYRNQITAVRKAIDSYGIPALHDITIDTVERYQGSQRDVIIYGFTVQHAYQLSFLAANTFIDDTTGAVIDRKLNVALTRAKKKEILVGNPKILSQNEVFRRLLSELMT